MKSLEHPVLAGFMYKDQGNDNPLRFMAFQGQLLTKHMLGNQTIQMPFKISHGESVGRLEGLGSQKQKELSEERLD